MKSVSESFRCRAGSKDWTESGPWTISGAGTHTIRWKFIKDSSGSSGSDCLWIDRIRWTGAMPDGEGWDRIEYAYDAAGRRIEKKIDGATQVKFVYDGDHIIAEYNNAGTLLRKYVHGPGVDQPICMIVGFRGRHINCDSEQENAWVKNPPYNCARRADSRIAPPFSA